MSSLLIAANSYAQSTGDNTTFRALGTAISNAFANAGWSHANDAGQINWTTVTANGTSGNVAGFEVWHMTDALQNTTPVYVKIEYGTAGNSNKPAWWLTIGNGSDGADNILGIPTPRIQVIGPSTNPANPIPWFFCGNPNRITIAASMVVAGSNVSPMVFSVERTHDNAGGDTSEGVLFVGATGGGVVSQEYWNGRTGPGPVEASVGAFIPAASISGTGSAFHWYPIYLNTGGGYTNPSLAVAYAGGVQFPARIPAALTHYGQPHIFLPLDNSPSVNRSAQTYTNFRMMMLWE